MFICTLKFDRKKAAFCIVIIGLILIGIILLAGAHSQKTAASGSVPEPNATVKNEKARVAYLAQCGWTVESPALREESAVIPRSFSSVFEKYNELQKQQGFDLSHYCGMELKLYTYRVLDSGLGDDVLAVLYVYDNCVVGGDVHSTALNGFMCGLRR